MAVLTTGVKQFTTTPVPTANPVAFANPANALTDDGLYATANFSARFQEAWLGFALSDIGLPADGKITGIQISVNCRATSSVGGLNTLLEAQFTSGTSSNSTRYGTFQQSSSGIGGGSGQSSNVFNVMTFGGSTNTLGLAAAQLQLSAFSSLYLQVAAYFLESSGTGVTDFDSVSIQVWYTVGEFSYTNTGVGTQTYTPTYDGIVTTAVTYPTVGASVGGGIGTWQTPNNVNASDNVRATMTFTGASGITSSAWPYLYATGYGFNIPTNATILGVTVGLEAVQTGGTTGNTRLNSLTLLKAGALAGSSLSTTANFPTTESVVTYGGPSNLWGNTLTPADINASNFGVQIHPLGTTAGTNRTLAVDTITVQVTYVVPASGDPTFSYSNSGVGSQTYVPRYDVTSSYTNTGVGTQTYAPSYGSSVTFSYTNSGTGSQTYTPTYKTSSSYSNTGVGSQSYSASYKTSSSYTNSGTGSQTYSATYTTSSSYSNSGVGSQTYAPRYDTSSSYLNTGVGTQSYSIALAGAGIFYINSGVGTQTYAPRFDTQTSYTNTGVSSQAYIAKYDITSSYTNTGVGTQTYAPVFVGATVAQPPGDGGWSNHGAKGRSIHAPRDIPKPTRQEKKNAKKAAKVKEHVVDQNAVDSLKSEISLPIPIDLDAIREIELARQMMEQELAQRIEEEEVQMVIVMALAHHRRNRFRRLAA